MENYPFEWKFEPVLLEMKVRFSIFFIIGASAGLPALVWSVGEVIEHRRNGHRISFFIILLLLTDFSEIFLSPYILIKNLLDEIFPGMDWTCRFFWALCWSSRSCGLLLNQLVALEGILSARNPRYSAAIFSSACFRIFQTLVFLSVTICWICLTMISFILIVVVFFIMSMITWVIHKRASCCAERHSHASRKLDQHIWTIFILTPMVIYLPILFAMFFLLSLYWDVVISVLSIPYFLTSLRLISDPLLCVLVCRQNLRLQISQNPEEAVVQSE